MVPICCLKVGHKVWFCDSFMLHFSAFWSNFGFFVYTVFSDFMLLLDNDSNKDLYFQYVLIFGTSVAFPEKLLEWELAKVLQQKLPLLRKPR